MGLPRKQSNEHVIFLSGDVELEGLLSVPLACDVRPGVVVCHPHPLYGGDLYNNVVAGVGAVLADAGYVVLRFNFRGVHHSGGSYAGGVGEVDDALSALRFLTEHERVDSGRLALAGYSFGAWIGVKAALKYSALTSLVCISPPLNVYDFDAVEQLQLPIMLASGEDDHLCSPPALANLYHKIKSRKELCIIPGGDHFLAGYEPRIGESILRFLACHL